MGSQSARLSEADKAFIAAQKLFFIASASGKEVNLSPRGYDSLRIIGDTEMLFLDYAGSGNRTARDIENDGEVTLLFCSFEQTPQILRLFCKGSLVDVDDVASRKLFEEKALIGMRRFVRLHIYCVEHSCGMSVPFYHYLGERDALRDWCADRVEDGKLEGYIQKHNTPPDLTPYK